MPRSDKTLVNVPLYGLTATPLGLVTALGILDAFSFRPVLTITVLDEFTDGFTFAEAEIVVRFKLLDNLNILIYSRKLKLITLILGRSSSYWF